MNIETLSPAYIGEDRIGLTLDTSSQDPKVFQIVQVNVDYEKAMPVGVELPLELVIQGPTEEGFITKIYRRIAPDFINFKPKTAGVYLVILRELAHNRWIGRLRVAVAGDPFEQV